MERLRNFLVDIHPAVWFVAFLVALIGFWGAMNDLVEALKRL